MKQHGITHLGQKSKPDLLTEYSQYPLPLDVTRTQRLNPLSQRLKGDHSV